MHESRSPIFLLSTYKKRFIEINHILWHDIHEKLRHYAWIEFSWESIYVVLIKISWKDVGDFDDLNLNEFYPNHDLDSLIFTN